VLIGEFEKKKIRTRDGSGLLFEMEQRGVGEKSD
jgi:hypothetical protein